MDDDNIWFISSFWEFKKQFWMATKSLEVAQYRKDKCQRALLDRLYVFGLSRVVLESLKARSSPSLLTPSFPHPNMIFAKASLIFAVVSFAAIFCTQSAEAARGPKITSKVYFDIKHGDQPMGRSAFTSFTLSSLPFKSLSDKIYSRVGPFRWRTLCWVVLCV